MKNSFVSNLEISKQISEKRKENWKKKRFYRSYHHRVIFLLREGQGIKAGQEKSATMLFFVT